MLINIVEELSTPWGDQVEAMEARGELEGGPASALPADEPEAQGPATEELSTPEEPSASPQSASPDESIWDVLARAAAAAEEFMGEPEAPSEPPLHPSQATLLHLGYRGKRVFPPTCVPSSMIMDWNILRQPCIAPWPGCSCSTATFPPTCAPGWPATLRLLRTHVRSLGI